MATINFKVPDDVKQAFNEEFAQEDKSAILTCLMQRTIIKKRQHDAIEAILALREKQEVVSADDISSAREELRK